MPSLKSQRSAPIFSKSFVLSAHTVSRLTHFELVFVCGMRSVPTSFFCMWIFGCPSIICWKTILDSLNRLNTLVKYQLVIYLIVYFWTFNSIPLIYLSIFKPRLYYHDYYSFFFSPCFFVYFIDFTVMLLQLSHFFLPIIPFHAASPHP